MNLFDTKQLEHDLTKEVENLERALDKIKDEVLATYDKEQKARYQIEIDKNQLLSEIELNKSIRNIALDRAYKQKMKQITDKDFILDEALFAGDKEQISRILSSMKD